MGWGSRRRFHADRLGAKPDPDLLYPAAMFHDTGLLTAFSGAEQRFEVDGADHARKFLLDRDFSVAAAETVWTAIALHRLKSRPETTNGIVNSDVLDHFVPGFQ
ncbi:HD domain-containing protein [Lentzea sp. BCCO 10_0856]|uniref:HD domain-containing protein n=1 Tax=Lentzea miocenica TaxID=3095431 RepID=A0ABU4SZX2_9PSEU|nr:HD domain-containing protein [Lentzea sp. BCCO 10_0856]MDX8031302.1 HD domain-containing protein [Lentzea sp. BCCO 10_0856]